METASAFKKRFIGKVKLARESADLTQEQIANALGIRQDTYKQYETRSALPHRFVAKFCKTCGVDERWLFANESTRARQNPPRHAA